LHGRPFTTTGPRLGWSNTDDFGERCPWRRTIVKPSVAPPRRPVNPAWAAIAYQGRVAPLLADGGGRVLERRSDLGQHRRLLADRRGRVLPDRGRGGSSDRRDGPLLQDLAGHEDPDGEPDREPDRREAGDDAPQVRRAPDGDLPCPEEVVGVVGNEIARYRIDDLVREAEAFRATGPARMARAAARRRRARRITAGVASVLLWPIRH
jgi:hypothetical protein